MKTSLTLLSFLLLFISASTSHAQLDFEQELPVIPDTHDSKPYIWDVTINPSDYEFSIEHGNLIEGEDTDFRFNLRRKSSGSLDDSSLHVFITDRDLQAYTHIRPAKSSDGEYNFTFNPPKRGRYRMEFVFKTDKAWGDFRETIKVKGGKKAETPSPSGLTDEGYSANVKLVPERAFTDHVVTFLYDLNYKGEPLSAIEKIDGHDMEVASWDRRLHDFVYALPKQNTGGPKVAVSLVFRLPGRHVVFAEFRHNGKTVNFRHVVDVEEEQVKKRGALFNRESSD